MTSAMRSIDDAVRTELHRRTDPEKIPLLVANELGVDVEDVARVLATVTADEEARHRRRMRRSFGVGLALVTGGFVVDQLLGTSRGIGAALALLAVVVVVLMLTWLLSEVRRL